MRSLFIHTIAFEPGRWSPARVSQNLDRLLPAIATLDVPELEVYEPHLALDPDESRLPELFAKFQLRPVILSSYLDVHPQRTSDSQFYAGAATLLKRVKKFGFDSVRIFPGPAINPANPTLVQGAAARLRELCQQAPETRFLLETHDGSIADDPRAVCALLDDMDCDNAALLYQPTEFTRECALSQLEIQAPRIRHIHLQNRKSDRSFDSLASGVIPWPEILSNLPEVSASLEFIPSAICPVEKFSLDDSIAEAAREIDYVRSLDATLTA